MFKESVEFNQKPKLRVIQGVSPIKPSTPETPYDSSRFGTESLPQLARLVYSTMVDEEIRLSASTRSSITFRINTKSAIDKAKNRFLEFVSENDTMSKLDPNFIAELINRSPIAVSTFFKEKAKTL